MTVQEDHDFPHDFLFGPCICDSFGSNCTNTGDFAEAFGFSFYDVKNFISEGLNQFFGIDRPNAPDHAGAKVFFDTLK